MHCTQGSPTPSYPTARRYRRFDLQFPVSLSFAADGAPRAIEAISKNVSVGGVLIEAGDQVPLRTQVSLMMNVVGPRSRRPVRLMGEGEVVRVEPAGAGAGFSIAVECRQPIAEIEECFPAGM
jgi:hypothetical protein